MSALCSTAQNMVHQTLSSEQDCVHPAVAEHLTLQLPQHMHQRSCCVDVLCVFG
jgi:hypothetical protein